MGVIILTILFLLVLCAVIIIPLLKSIKNADKNPRLNGKTGWTGNKPKSPNLFEIKIVEQKEKFKLTIRYYIYGYGTSSRMSVGMKGNLRVGSSKSNTKTRTKHSEDVIYISKDLSNLENKLTLLKANEFPMMNIWEIEEDIKHQINLIS